MGTIISFQDGIWADVYQPTTEQELAVHKKKVETVRRWLTDAFSNSNLKKYRKLLVLSGPAGAGKTATLRVISRELKLDIIEWQNTTDDVFSEDDYESAARKFQAFLNRASDMTPLMQSGSTSRIQSSPRQIILLEDLPNLLHGPTLQAFQRSIENHLARSETPIVLIISDAGAGGQFKDEEGWNRQPSVMDVRTILPTKVLQEASVLRIDFNPIAATFMKKALQGIVDRYFGSASKSKPSKPLLDAIVESSGGDIRSALMALQFSTAALSSKGSSSSKKGSTSLQVITRREHSLALFHLLGKLLYNKRIGDPLNESLSKADREKERKLERLLPPPPSLPSHLSEFQRPISRIDVETLYSESPVDSSLLSLYLHQNYYQFCQEVEQCEGVIETLSSFDAAGDTWDSRGQVAAEKFYGLTMGTLMSLPSPVPRNSQKMYKPDFFDHLKRSQQANDAVSDVQEWLWRKRDLWSSDNLRLWLPSVVKKGGKPESLHALPPQYQLFACLPWERNASIATSALEENDDSLEPTTFEVKPKSSKELKESEERIEDASKADDKYWLEEDDIAEF